MAAATVPAGTGRLGLARFAGPLAVVLVALVFAVCHPYAGIRGDATIYLLRALADLDPARLGRDLMVVEDGQMRFSLFPLLLRPLVAGLGAATAAMLVAAAGSVAWFAALAALAQRLAPGRVGWAMAAMVAVLPSGYGDHGLFAFAETAATPRPFAEAAVMAALAALIAERRLAACAWLGVAILLHPIMALPGVGAAVLVVASRLPARGRLALAAGVALAGGAALTLGLPAFARVVARPDGTWLDLLHLHSPHLFPTLWTAEAFTPLIAQAATIAVAAHRAPHGSRRFYLAVLGIGALGLAGAAILGDTAHLLIVLQAQTWRAAWLVGAVGGCALAACVASLRGDARGRLVLALLALAWLFQPTPLLTLVAASLALLLELGPRSLPLADRHVELASVCVGVLVAACALLWAAGTWIGYLAFLDNLSPDDHPSLVDPLRNNLQTLPLLVLAAAWLMSPAERFRNDAVTIALAGAVLVFGVVVGRVWDQRTVAQIYLESPRDPRGLAALAAGRKPEVLWLDDESDAWFVLGRPQYFSPQQGVAMVFSRPLAMEWARRAVGLVALGLEPRRVFAPWQAASVGDRARVTQSAVDALCARPEAPGLLIMPKDAGGDLRDSLAWPLPAPLFRVEPSGEHGTRLLDRFAVVPCGAALPR